MLTDFGFWTCHLLLLTVFQIISLRIFVVEELKETLPVIFIDVRPVGKVAE
jgi:hypothetical protein